MRLALMLSVLLAGCGPDAAAGAWLRIEAPLVVPAACDAVSVRVVREGETAPRLDRSWELTEGMRFPLTLSLIEEEAADIGGPPFVVTTRALLGGELAEPWAQKTTRFSLVEGEIVDHVVELCDCQ